MEWDGSIKTLPEHETDASREGELGVPGKSYHQFSLLMGKDPLPNPRWCTPGDMAESILV